MATNTDLKQAGLKTTRPRLQVLAVLENSHVRHMTAEDVYQILLKDGQPIGLATVYRVLTQFENAGLVIRNKFESERAVFELNDEAHHDHLICVKCGLVVEFCDERIEAQQTKVAQQHGFTIHDHALTLYGKCQKCAAKSAAKSTAKST